MEKKGIAMVYVMNCPQTCSVTSSCELQLGTMHSSALAQGHRTQRHNQERMCHEAIRPRGQLTTWNIGQHQKKGEKWAM
jgi:hypothetical protein